MVSSAHAVCSKGLYIAMISTTVETDKPELEIRPAVDLLGDILEMFVQISPVFEPVDDGTKDRVRFKFIHLTISYLLPRATMLPVISSKPVMKYLSSTKESQERS